MPRNPLLKAFIVVALCASFVGIFKLLQRPKIYFSTLAKISGNYERIGDAKRYKIEKIKKPFIELTEANAYRWDGLFYRGIRDSLYTRTDKYSYAFYPLFPLVWKISGIRCYLILFFNYLLFALAIILLSGLLMKDKKSDIFIFTLALLLPSAIVFYLPYAESLFVLSLVIACIGLFKKKYWIYFIGVFAFAMTRPAELIFLCAIISADIGYLIQHRKYWYFFKELGLKILPLVAGKAVVMGIQYYYSGSWTIYFDTWALWPKESGFFNKITDWSTQGFSMTVFAIFFLALPSFIYTLRWGISALLQKEKKIPLSLFEGNEEWIKEYMFQVSLLFIVGVLGYTIVTSGNVLNGFFRYTMNIPFFFIILFQLPQKLTSVPLKYKILSFILCLLAIACFLYSIAYTGNMLRFDYVGLYLFTPIALLIIFEPYLSQKAKIISLLLLWMPCLIWQTYLFNMYLCDAWIFT